MQESPLKLYKVHSLKRSNIFQLVVTFSFFFIIFIFPAFFSKALELLVILRRLRHMSLQLYFGWINSVELSGTLNSLQWYGGAEKIRVYYTKIDYLSAKGSFIKGSSAKHGLQVIFHMCSDLPKKVSAYHQSANFYFCTHKINRNILQKVIFNLKILIPLYLCIWIMFIRCHRI